MAIGCIQAQRCHTDRCPTGVATQNPWLTARPRPGAQVGRGSPTTCVALRGELLALARTCGVAPPGARRPRPAGGRLRALTPRAAARGVRLRAEWPLLSNGRRIEAQELIGRPATRPAPGPGAGEHAGFPGAGDPSRSHMDARSRGETASEAG